jgi:transcription termination/antitermination protein NusG
MGLTERELCQDPLHGATDCPPMDCLRWYALAAKHQHERRIEVALRSNGFEALAPMYRVRRSWSDRMKEIDLPLFAGYVFCRFVYRQRVRVLNTPGVRGIVGFGHVPAPIPDGEISTIQAVLRSKLPVRPWPLLRPGDRVHVERGPLRGLEGTLLKEKNSLRLVVGVELLQRSIAAELDPYMIVPVRGPGVALARGA